MKNGLRLICVALFSTQILAAPIQIQEKRFIREQFSIYYFLIFLETRKITQKLRFVGIS